MKGIWILVLVLGMLFTGTINTILNKLQDMTCVEHCDDPNPAKREYFEQPVWQVCVVLACIVHAQILMFFAIRHSICLSAKRCVWWYII